MPQCQYYIDNIIAGFENILPLRITKKIPADTAHSQYINSEILKQQKVIKLCTVHPSIKQFL